MTVTLTSSPNTPSATHGRLTIVGVGPGAPDLLTLRAVRRIADADVVAYPRTENGRARAHEIACEHIAPHAAHLAYALPMSQDRAPAQQAYDALAGDLSAAMAGGAHVCLLCEGDPMFFGSAMYVLERLRAAWPIEVVPGISSVMAAAAAAAHPLAARDEVFTVLPATLPDAELATALRDLPALTIMKVGRHLPRVRRLVLAHGFADALLIEDAQTPSQRLRPLAQVDENETVGYFSLIIARRAAHASPASALQPQYPEAQAGENRRAAGGARDR
ncbi:MAG: precorrin-2 C(20)-methyltransferase [Pseudomonadota bacterium]